jgi:hypothetical protein
MANPIKETPVLYGKDARRFAERIAHVKKEPMEKRERIIRAYELFQKTLVINDMK